MRALMMLAALALVLATARPAGAIRCQDWNRLDDGQKSATVARMIGSAVSGQRGREYRVDRAAIGRCLEENADAMQADFDGACSDARTAGAQAIDRIFKNYIWSCAG